MRRKRCYELFKPFKVGTISVREYSSPDRIPTLTNDENFDRLRAAISLNLRLTLREFSDEVGIRIGSNN
jgi:hypothetical protein